MASSPEWSLLNDNVSGVPKGKKAATAPRKRKSAMKDFQTKEEYQRFAKSRNAATKKCRQKKEEELKTLRDENPELKKENARLKGRVADLERELEEALCKLKLGTASPGPAEVVTLAPSSDAKRKKQKEPDLVQQAMDTSLGEIFGDRFDDLVFRKDGDDKTVAELDISIIPSVPYMPELDPFQLDPNVIWSG